MNQRVGYQYLESPSIVHQFPIDFVIYELSAQNNIVSGNNNVLRYHYCLPHYADFIKQLFYIILHREPVSR